MSNILNSRIRRNRLQYQVRYKGLNVTTEEWRFASDVFAPDLIREFHLCHPTKPTLQDIQDKENDAYKRVRRINLIYGMEVPMSDFDISDEDCYNRNVEDNVTSVAQRIEDIVVDEHNGAL